MFTYQDQKATLQPAYFLYSVNQQRTAYFTLKRYILVSLEVLKFSLTFDELGKSATSK